MCTSIVKLSAKAMKPERLCSSSAKLCGTSSETTSSVALIANTPSEKDSRRVIGRSRGPKSPPSAMAADCTGRPATSARKAAAGARPRRDSDLAREHDDHVRPARMAVRREPPVAEARVEAQVVGEPLAHLDAHLRQAALAGDGLDRAHHRRPAAPAAKIPQHAPP